MYSRARLRAHPMLGQPPPPSGPPSPTKNFQGNPDFIEETSNILQDLTISRNEPLKSTDIYYIIIFKNETNFWSPINLQTKRKLGLLI